jgi:hypothetical protein
MIRMKRKQDFTEAGNGCNPKRDAHPTLGGQ